MAKNSDFVQFSVRLTKAEHDALLRRVEESNDTSEKAGLPRAFNVSRIARHLIVSQLEVFRDEEQDEDRPPTKTLRPATDLNNALAKLRGHKS